MKHVALSDFLGRATRHGRAVAYVLFYGQGADGRAARQERGMEWMGLRFGDPAPPTRARDGLWGKNAKLRSDECRPHARGMESLMDGAPFWGPICPHARGDGVTFPSQTA